ncbi:MAG: PASTA domain-containing protein [Gemmatimonadetes bacterium]|nr:PASTA domain-containing protein [Gemmatimonadota bacterium]
MKIGESIRRRRSSKDNGRPRREKPRRVALPAWKLTRGWRPNREGKRERQPRLGDLKRRPGTPVLALILAAIGLGSGYFVSTTWLFPSPEPPPAPQGVPDLRGSPLAGAMALLADSGLTAGRVDSIRHPLAPAGSVIGQNPLPGRTALPGAEVHVTMSMGPEIRSVPDVTRLRGERAAATLEAGGFLVQVDTVESQAPAGRIVAIDPPPGTETTMPGSVRLQVSQGPPTFPMPSLLGFGELEARSLLAALGLTVSEIDRRYSILNVNRVFGQNPAPSANVGAGTRVRLIVGQSMGWTLYEPSSGAFPAHSEHSRTVPGSRRVGN